MWAELAFTGGRKSLQDPSYGWRPYSIMNLQQTACQCGQVSMRITYQYLPPPALRQRYPPPAHLGTLRATPTVAHDHNDGGSTKTTSTSSMTRTRTSMTTPIGITTTCRGQHLNSCAHSQQYFRSVSLIESMESTLSSKLSLEAIPSNPPSCRVPASRHFHDFTSSKRDQHQLNRQSSVSPDSSNSGPGN